VAHARRRDRQFVVTRKGERPGDVLDAVHFDDAVYFGLVEATGIIDAAAELRPFYPGKRRNRLDPCQIDLALLTAIGGGPAILFTVGIGGQRLELAEAVNAKHRDQHGDNGRAGFEFSGKPLH
jgi:hypothetical protein